MSEDIGPMERYRDLIDVITGITAKHIWELEGEIVSNYVNGDPDFPAQVQFLKGLYRDHYRYKKVQSFRGWNYSYNPYFAIELDNPMSHTLTPPEMLEVMHHSITKGHAYLGIGFWTSAEEYYQLALSIAFVTHNMPAVFQISLHLSQCYLYGDDNINAFRIGKHCLPAAIHADNYLTIDRLFTVMAFALLRVNRVDTIQELVSRYKRNHLNKRILDDGKEIYEFRQDIKRIRALELDWQRLNDIMRDIS